MADAASEIAYRVGALVLLAMVMWGVMRFLGRNRATVSERKGGDCSEATDPNG